MGGRRTAIVIGGGLIGCSCAWYLQQRDWHVTILERDRIGGGASHGNCGFVCPSHALPLSGPGVIAKTLPSAMQPDAALAIPLRYDPSLWNWLLRFARECSTDRMLHAAAARNALLASSMNLYREFIANQAIDCEWRDRGLLLVFKSARDFDRYEKTAELLRREFSIEATSYAGEAVQRLEPALRFGLAGGWHFPGDAHVRPDKLMRGFKSALEDGGADIQERVEVLQLRIESGNLTALGTSEGVLSADLVVLATGAEAPQFASTLGCRIPIQPGKGYSLTMPALKKPPRIPMIFEQHHVAVTPLESALRVGSTMEFTGYDRSLKKRRLALLRRSAEQHLAEPLPKDVCEEWTGWRPMVYDGLPCIDRAPAANNVIVAAGNGMIGLATAPATGKLVAELASDERPHLDLAPFSLSRFS